MLYQERFKYFFCTCLNIYILEQILLCFTRIIYFVMYCIMFVLATANFGCCSCGFRVFCPLKLSYTISISGKYTVKMQFRCENYVH